MPKSWTKKDEKQYEHIKKSAKDRGRDESRAEEIAARTVNKQRREEGRATKSPPRGTGNPNSSLDGRSKSELYHRAQELSIEGRSQMSKNELIEAIRKRS